MGKIICCFFSFLTEAIILWQYASGLFAAGQTAKKRCITLCGLYLVLFAASLFDSKSRGYAMTTGSAGGMSRPLWGIFRFRLQAVSKQPLMLDCLLKEALTLLFCYFLSVLLYISLLCLHSPVLLSRHSILLPKSVFHTYLDTLDAGRRPSAHSFL